MTTALARRPHDPGLFLALAPMDGVTDYGHRKILTDLFSGSSGISLCVSEFVRVTDLCVSPKVLRAHCPELTTAGCTDAGVPVFVQLLGGKPEPMAQSAALAAQLGAPGIDLNFGCPAKTVNRHDGGASLLKEPSRIETITAAVREALPNNVPVTVKIRTGWENSHAIADIARAAESGGASWLTVHGRTRMQLYRPPIDWHAIADAQQAINIPVVANGDIVDPSSLERCARESRCQGFMIGRGAMAFPGLFARLRGWRNDPFSRAELATVLREYGAPTTTTAYTNAETAPGAGRTLRRLKQWLRMAAALRPDMRDSFDTIKRLQDLETAIVALDKLVTAVNTPEV